MRCQQLLLALTLTLASCVVMVTESKLCTPDQWECLETVTTGVVFQGQQRVEKQLVKFSYDATRERQSSFESHYVGDKVFKSHTVWVYGVAGKPGARVYMLDLNTSRCTIKDLDVPFQRFCIPAEAHHIGDHVLGVKGQGLTVSVYSYVGGYFYNMTSVASIITQADGQTYLPVSEVTYGTHDNKSTMSNWAFTDITLGIANPSIFDIPPQCKQVD